MGRILITGATGFVGRALVPVLASQHGLVLAGRRASRETPPGTLSSAVGEIGPGTDWSAALRDVDQIVHLAAHVHQLDHTGDPGAFHRVNCAGTQRLAEAARNAGVRRIIFLSSVKVNGEASGSQPFREEDVPRPEGLYAQSKFAAEQALAEIASAGGPAAIILRPPLVYGPGAKANFRALIRLCRLGLPLPFGAVDNRRSLIFIGNLVAAIERALAEPVRPGCRTYLLRDGEDLSTADLIRRIGIALGRPTRLLPVPQPWLRGLLTLAGRGAAADRLLGSLTVDDSRFRHDYAWQPTYSVDEGLAATASSYR